MTGPATHTMAIRALLMPSESKNGVPLDSSTDQTICRPPMARVSRIKYGMLLLSTAGSSTASACSDNGSESCEIGDIGEMGEIGPAKATPSIEEGTGRGLISGDCSLTTSSDCDPRHGIRARARGVVASHFYRAVRRGGENREIADSFCPRKRFYDGSCRDRRRGRIASSIDVLCYMASAEGTGCLVG